MLRAYLFGGLALAWDQDPLPTPAGSVAPALLGYLVAYHDRPHTRDLLAGTFWPDVADAAARRRLSQALWQIRRSVNPHPLLLSEGDTVQLNPALELWLDVEQFETQYARCTAGATDGCEQCAELYTGEFLPGYYHDWVLREQERLRTLWLDVLGRLVQGYKGRGDYERALLWARRLAAENPWQEEAHREIMRLCHLLKQDGEALRQYEVCRQIMMEELDAEPSAETAALAAEISARAGLSAPPPPLPTAGRPVVAPLLERPDRLPLVGRQPELADLLRRLEAAAGGHGGFAIVYGGAGVGKSRLLRELADNAGWRGIPVLWGRSYELTAPPAYQPLVEVLRAGLVSLEAPALEPWWRSELARLLPELSARGDHHPSLSPAEEQRRLLEAIAQGFFALGESSPHLVLLEDAHWMDVASLEALRYLLPRLDEAGLLIVVTVRTEELAGRQRELLDAVENTRLCHRLELEPLDLGETGELVQRALDLHQPAPHFSGRLYAETEGNPFFLIETLWALLEDGLLYRDEAGEWNVQIDDATDRYAELPLPAGVAQSVERRLNRLPPSLNESVGLAAVIGRGIDFGLWLLASDQDEQSLLQVGDELCARGLLLGADPDYVFAHDQIRRIAYQRLAPPRRRFYHRQVARALTELAPDEPAVLAYHWTRAEVWDRAAGYHQQAGDQARAVYANSKAAAHYTQALEALAQLPGPADPDVSYALYLSREEMHHLLGERAAQSQDLEALARLAATSGDFYRRAEVALRRARYCEVTADYPAAIAAALEAIDLASAAGDRGLEAAGYQRWGQALWRQGDYQSARTQLERALSLGCEAGMRHAEADCLRNLGVVCWYLGDLAAAQAHFQQAYAIFCDLDDRLGEATALNNLALVAVNQGDYLGAKASFERAVAIYRQVGNRFSEALTLGNLGSVLSDVGDYAGSQAYHEQALALCRKIGSRQTEAVQLGCLSLLYHRLGDHQTARAYGEQVVSIGEELGDRLAQAYGLTYLGHVLAALGDLPAAERSYRQAWQIRRELGQETMAVELVAALARVALAQGDRAQAEAQVEQILDTVQTESLEGADSPFSVYLTCFRILAGRQDERAEGVLRTAHRVLQAQIDRIDDPAVRQMFEGIAVHQEVMAAYRELEAAAPPAHPQSEPGQTTTVLLPRHDAPLGRPLQDDEWVRVTWTIRAREDETAIGKVARRRQQLVRLLREASAQGAAPAHHHLAEALGVSQRTIERDMVVLRQEIADLPPTRGKMSD